MLSILVNIFVSIYVSDRYAIQLIFIVKAKVHLDVSNLTRFQSSVYKKILESSIKNGRGGITFTSSTEYETQSKLVYYIHIYLG